MRRALLATIILALAAVASGQSSADDSHCSSFIPHDTFNKARLGATYLINPDKANRAEVVWTYSIDDAKVQAKANNDYNFYLKPKGTSNYVVVGKEASGKLLSQYGTIGELKEAAVSKNYEIGFAETTSQFASATPTGSLINWDGPASHTTPRIDLKPGRVEFQCAVIGKSPTKLPNPIVLETKRSELSPRNTPPGPQNPRDISPKGGLVTPQNPKK